MSGHDFTSFAAQLETSGNVTVARDLLSTVFRTNVSGMAADTVFTRLRNHVGSATAAEVQRAQVFITSR